jgi:ADP-heptose:LPS heptosyltransferase
MPNPDKIEELKREYLELRRQEKEQFFSTPFRKRVIRKIEQLNKRLTLGLLGKALRIKHTAGKISLDDISSVIILRYDALGDMVVTSPLWRILRNRKPELKIGIGGSSRNLEILRCDPDVDHVYNFSFPDKKLREAEFAKARSEKYDLVIACLLNQKTRGAVIARRTSSKGITATLVHDQIEPHNKIFSKTAWIPKWNYPMPMVLQLEYLLENIVDLKIKEEERRPSIMIAPEALAKIKSATDNLLAESGSNRYIVLNTESATEFREWGYENNYRFAKEISDERPGTLVLLTSSPLREQALIEYFEKQTPHLHVRYFPTRNLHELAALVRYSSLVVSPDTSLIHFATAEAKPTVGLYIQHNVWLPFRVPAKIYIPQKEQPISSIPINIVKEGTLELLDNLTSAPNIIDIFYCEEPSRNERIIPD